MHPDTLKDLMRRYGIKPNFTYGQNFLLDDVVLQDIVDTAAVTKDDIVFEIGPGIGNLTKLLCERAGFVLSIDKDPKFFPMLKAIKKEHKNLRFEISDALDFDFQKSIQDLIGERGEGIGDSKSTTPVIQYKVVANIPYYITGKILQMLMGAKHKPTSVTILTQKEVARNVIAKPGNLSILAISVQLFGEPSIAQIVPARSFYPAPKVDSAVLHIELFKTPKYILPDEKKFFRVVKACFAGKRKQIHNTLVNNLGVPKDQVEQLLASAGVPTSARPQELTIDQWILLTAGITN